MLDQPFNVIYKNEIIPVDSSFLYKNSRKFQELIDNAPNLQKFQLKINYDKFSERNVSNFLKICQNQSTDVQNSELEEICLIAKMFQADQIYNTGIIFIQNNIDPNFFIPYNKFNEDNCVKYLYLESELEEEIPLLHHIDLNELEFDDSCEFTEAQNENKDNNSNSNQKKQRRTACYQITWDNPPMKCRRFYLKMDNKVICMAKQKDDEIYIGNGKDIHISENKFHNTARITRNREGYNIVNINEQEFKIKYIKFGSKYSISLSFMHDGMQLSWRPKQLKRLENFKGGYNHIPLPSNKNIVLQNPSNHPTIIVRKMAKKTYEAECNPLVNQFIVFAIALSQIVGPISMQK